MSPIERAYLPLIGALISAPLLLFLIFGHADAGRLWSTAPAAPERSCAAPRPQAGCAPCLPVRSADQPKDG